MNSSTTVKTINSALKQHLLIHPYTGSGIASQLQKPNCKDALHAAMTVRMASSNRVKSVMMGTWTGMMGAQRTVRWRKAGCAPGSWAFSQSAPRISSSVAMASESFILLGKVVMMETSTMEMAAAVSVRWRKGSSVKAPSLPSALNVATSFWMKQRNATMEADKMGMVAVPPVE